MMRWGTLLTRLGEARAWSWGAFTVAKAWALHSGVLEGGRLGGKSRRTGQAELSWGAEEEDVDGNDYNKHVLDLRTSTGLPLSTTCEPHTCSALEVWVVPVHRWNGGGGGGFAPDHRTSQCSACFIKPLSGEVEMFILSTSPSREPRHGWGKWFGQNPLEQGSPWRDR